MLTRRHFLSLSTVAGAAALLPRGNAQTAPPEPAVFRATNKKIASVPHDFTGLSYEIVQLYNPAFFSATNSQLVAAFRQLTPRGVLRLGGNLSDLARWKGESGDFSTPKQAAAIERSKTYWEWKLTDSTVQSGRDGAITPAAIRNLKGFLDATNWRLIYGLNFGSGSPERAADEAATVAHEMGNRLIAFQIGNESDFFGGNRLFRERPFGFAEYYSGFQEFARAVRARVPTALFAGPDTANNMGWVEELAKAQLPLEAKDKAVLLSSHYYAMGPAKNPAMNAERLLSPNPHLQDQIASAQKATADSGGIPFRMTEGNSCFGGGKPEVSDAYASALWVADYMLRLASAGYAGVNLHGGGDGIYTPIETLDASVAKPRPIYWGMQLADRFSGADMLSVELETKANLTAYLGRSKNSIQLVLINKGDSPVRVAVESGLPHKKPTEMWRLSGPDLAAKSGVTLGNINPDRSVAPLVPPYTAELRRWTV
jgi:hypothetical protein